MQNQKHLFDLSPEITYLNGAYMAPQLKSVTEIGLQSVQRKHILMKSYQKISLLKKKF